MGGEWRDRTEERLRERVGEDGRGGDGLGRDDVRERRERDEGEEMTSN